ncbi:gastrula zinc finger protein XlCGF28.1-like [Silurus meridionalis]|nr:gastrula zinc finger protein XlCGF28.1-like [Silurus meridionalis]
MSQLSELWAAEGQREVISSSLYLLVQDGPRWQRGSARLKANPSRPALPSILLVNVCSLNNKLDYIRLQQATRHEYRHRCIFVFTETWLSDRVPDSAIQLDGLAVFRADRNAALCGKTPGGGLCVYINTEWCKNSFLVSTYCSSLLEFMVVRCRPFYLPREFTTAIVFGVYIPPSVNAKEAFSVLYGTISELQNTHPDGWFIVTGDFNHANPRTVLPKFHQNVNFATRGENTLDVVYTNDDDMIPAYRPLSRRSRPVRKQRTSLGHSTPAPSPRVQQRLYFLRRLRKAPLPPPILTTFYRGTIESILSSCITAWFENCTISDRKTLQRIVRTAKKTHRTHRIVRTAEKIIRVSLPFIVDIHTTRCIRKAHSMPTPHTPHTHPTYTHIAHTHTHF